MQHISDILKQLGFNKEAPETTKQAFIRHLQKAAQNTGSGEPNPSDCRNANGRKSSIQPNQQLSFEFTDYLPLTKSKRAG